MNQFSPMSEDKTPQPHRRFFGAEAPARPDNNTKEESPAPLPDFKANQIPEESDIILDQPVPQPTPQHDHVQKENEKPKLNSRDEEYFKITREYLERTRKERNAIILKIDKISDERIENATSDYDISMSKIHNLQDELWHKNSLIEALTKVLVSLK